MSELLDQLNQAEGQLRAEAERVISIAQAAVAQAEFDANRAAVLEAMIDELEAEVASLPALEEENEALKAEILKMTADREYISE